MRSSSAGVKPALVFGVLVPLLGLVGVVAAGADGGAVPPGVVVEGVLGELLVPGTLAPGVLAPGVVTPGIVTPGIVTPGVVAPGVAVVGGVMGVAAAGVVTVVVTGGLEPDPSASLTSAAARTPSASAAMTASEAIGAFQLGVAASRVRAAAPQFRHQSCLGSSGAPHSGHASPTLGRSEATAGK